MIEAIGNTPIVRLSKITTKPELWVKLEYFNPTGSIKDRIAYHMIKKAEERGVIKPGMTLLVPTTGNTGISFAAIGKYLGYKIKIIIPSKMSMERYQLLGLYGVELIKTEGGETDAEKSLEYAYTIADKNPDKYYVIDQWSNYDNVEAHYLTTGSEIVNQLGKIDVFISLVGTGGTLIGTGLRLKENNPNIVIIGVEPSECPIITNWFKGKNLSHCKSHLIEGVGDGFIPKIIKQYSHLIDDFITISGKEALNMAIELAKLEGLAVGISSGGNVAAAIKISKKYGLNKDKRIVTLLPDNALRYFSTKLFKRR